MILSLKKLACVSDRGEFRERPFAGYDYARSGRDGGDGGVGAEGGAAVCAVFCEAGVSGAGGVLRASRPKAIAGASAAVGSRSLLRMTFLVD